MSRGIRRVLLALAALVAGASLFPITPIVDLETTRLPEWARLHVSAAYVLLAPFSAGLDALSLLTSSQHVAVGVSLVIGAAVLFTRALRAGMASGSRRLGRAAGLGLVTFLGLFAIYASIAILPRPMARLVLHRDDLLAIDFHSHTDQSHDGRRGFSREANRRWHQAAGFDVAFVTDHGKADDVRGGDPGSDRLVSGRTALMAGVEFATAGVHVVQLTDEAVSMVGAPEVAPVAHGDGAASPGQSMAMTQLPTPVPTRILTLPGRFGPELLTFSGSSAMEYVDAAPRGLEQSRASAAALRDVADRSNVALVAGSNNHGWGRTAAAWSVMQLPGWRHDSVRVLGRRIVGELNTRRRNAVHVVARRGLPASTSTLDDVLILPRLAIMVSRTLTPAERASSLAWLLIPVLIGVLRDRRRTRLTADLAS